jgi:hypothetical protein
MDVDWSFCLTVPFQGATRSSRPSLPFTGRFPVGHCAVGLKAFDKVLCIFRNFRNTNRLSQAFHVFRVFRNPYSGAAQTFYLSLAHF